MIDLAKNWRNKFDGEILGITGSNGKTTTKELIGHILSQNINCQYNEMQTPKKSSPINF